MTSIGLFFVGAVLLTNGLNLLGFVEAKAAAPINVLVGALLLVVTFAVALPVADPLAAANRPALVSAGGFLLFAFTYLLVAFVDWTSQSGKGLGWYCGWACLVSLFIAVVNFVQLGDARFGVVWLAWTVLFAMFFVVLALGRDAAGHATGWLTVLQAFTTTTVPGALELTGLWSRTPLALVVVLEAAPIVVLVYLLLTRRPRRSGEERTPQPVGARS